LGSSTKPHRVPRRVPLRGSVPPADERGPTRGVAPFPARETAATRKRAGRTDGRGRGDEGDGAHVRAAVRTDQRQQLEQPGQQHGPEIAHRRHRLWPRNPEGTGRAAASWTAARRAWNGKARYAVYATGGPFAQAASGRLLSGAAPRQRKRRRCSRRTTKVEV